MSPARLAYAQGFDDARAALRRWNAAPLPTVAAWAVAIALPLLVVASLLEVHLWPRLLAAAAG